MDGNGPFGLETPDIGISRFDLQPGYLCQGDMKSRRCSDLQTQQVLRMSAPALCKLDKNLHLLVLVPPDRSLPALVGRLDRLRHTKPEKAGFVLVESDPDLLFPRRKIVPHAVNTRHLSQLALEQSRYFLQCIEILPLDFDLYRFPSRGTADHLLQPDVLGSADVANPAAQHLHQLID